MLKRMKELRMQAGISQKMLAEKIGVSQQSINKYENHSIEPDIETLIRISDVFSITVDELIGHENEETPQMERELNWEEQKLIHSYRRLNESERKSIQMVIENYLQ